MKLRLNYLLAAGLAVALIAAGCGKKNSNVAHLTKTQFIAKADAICASARAQSQAQVKALLGGGTTANTAQLKSVAKLVGDGIVAQVAKIRALPAPSGDANTITAILDAADRGGKQLAANPSQLNAKGVPNADLQNANSQAKSYGLKVCGQG